jgi:voltage-gated potassium channel
VATQSSPVPPVSAPRRRPLAAATQKVRDAPRPNLVERRMSRFLREPPTIRTAASVIVSSTVVVVVASGALIRVLDHHEYPNIWLGMWWALQTVTTVGYGDVTPKDVAGRVVGAFVMLEGIAFLAIVTAAITSTFIARSEHERRQEGAAGAMADARIEARLDELAQRLDRLESLIREQRGT